MASANKKFRSKFRNLVGMAWSFRWWPSQPASQPKSQSVRKER